MLKTKASLSLLSKATKKSAGAKKIRYQEMIIDRMEGVLAKKAKGGSLARSAAKMPPG